MKRNIMEQAPVIWTKDAIAILSFLGGIASTLIITTWKASGFAARMDNVEKDIDVLQKVVFKDNGGLHLLSEDRHTDVCRVNQELFAKDLEPLAHAVLRLEKRLERIEEKLDTAWKFDHEKRQGHSG